MEVVSQLLDILAYFHHSCPAPNIHAAQFQFTGHSLDLLDNVLHDWLFPHHCIYTYIHTSIRI